MDISHIFQHLFRYVKESLHYVKENLDWIALVLTLLVLAFQILSVHLQWKVFGFTSQRRKEKEDKKREEREVLEARRRRQVPNIPLGNTILITPTLIEAGITNHLAAYARIENVVNFGQWVNKGEELLTLQYDIFNSENFPKVSLWDRLYWRMVGNVRSLTHPISMTSPTSGLVIGFRRCQSNDIAIYRMDKGEGGFPIILLPQDNTEPDHYNISFYQRVIADLKSYWTRLVCEDGYGGDMRLGDKMPGLGREVIDQVQLQAFEVRDITSIDRQLLSGIQNIRDQHQYLWNKLVHLARLR